jgi:putative DNA methylase
VDLFAGGGAIPLEAARLGCDATAIELNPVAHLIERAMLEFPHRNPNLGADVRRWGAFWVDRAWKHLADLYPPVGPGTGQQTLGGDDDVGRHPLAYLWTRTVRCPNPALPEHQVDLVRQTWLARRSGRAIALRPVVDRTALSVRYEVVEASSADALGFDPAAGSKRGQAICRVCGATATGDYVKAEGRGGRMGIAPLAAVVLKPSGRGRDYLPVGDYLLPDDDYCRQRLTELPIEPPEERLVAGDTKNFWVVEYGLTRFRDLFTPRQLLTMCTLAASVREVYDDMRTEGMSDDRAAAVATCLALSLDRAADYMTVLCQWHTPIEKTNHTFARQALPMVWDFSEVNPFFGASGDIRGYVQNTADIIDQLEVAGSAVVRRASATGLPLPDTSQDAVITDPPYYDNISYADLSDFFYVWLKRSVGFLYPEDLGGDSLPSATRRSFRHTGIMARRQKPARFTRK